MQLSLFGLLLLTQPLHSSEQHTRANLDFSSNFGNFINRLRLQIFHTPCKRLAVVGCQQVYERISFSTNSTIRQSYRRAGFVRQASQVVFLFVCVQIGGKSTKYVGMSNWLYLRPSKSSPAVL